MDATRVSCLGATLVGFVMACVAMVAPFEPRAVESRDYSSCGGARYNHSFEREWRDIRKQLEMEDLDGRIAHAIDSVVAAQSDADRLSAHAKLVRLRSEKADIERRIAKAKRIARNQDLCSKNPFAEPCR